MLENESYKEIFKSTFLFGFVQICKILIGIVKNKFIALFLGVEGVGIIGVFSSTISLIQTGAGLGISQSAVRIISETNKFGDSNKLDRVVSIVNKIVLLTGLLGGIIAIVCANQFSILTMGSSEYRLSYIVLSVSIVLNIINEGKLAILKGTRSLRYLAYSSIITSFVALLTSVPLYYYFGQKGIIFDFLIGSFIGILVSNRLLKKFRFNNENIPLKVCFLEASPMIKMGIALMLVSFLDAIVTLVITVFIREHGGLDDVGYYSVGKTITTSYFGIIITALSTDYYPRISAIHSDNYLLASELNKQSITGLILCFPLVVLFMILLNFLIQLLYTSEFLPACLYIQYGILGTLIVLCSNQVDMILIVKFKAKLFIIISVIYRIIQLMLSLILYDKYGLVGMGITATIMGLLHFIIMTIVVYKLYGIRYDTAFIKTALVVFLFTIFAIILSFIDVFNIKLLCGSALFVFSCAYSYIMAKKMLNFDLSVLKKIIITKLQK